MARASLMRPPRPSRALTSHRRPASASLAETPHTTSVASTSQCWYSAGTGGTCRREASRPAAWSSCRGGTVAARGRDVAVGEREAVVGGARGGAAGEAKAMQRLVQPIAAGVAGEHAAGAVGPMGPGCQTDEEQPGIRVPEARHRLAPVGPVAILGFFGEGD